MSATRKIIQQLNAEGFYSIASRLNTGQTPPAEAASELKARASQAGEIAASALALAATL